VPSLQPGVGREGAAEKAIWHPHRARTTLPIIHHGRTTAGTGHTGLSKSGGHHQTTIGTTQTGPSGRSLPAPLRVTSKPLIIARGPAAFTPRLPDLHCSHDCDRCRHSDCQKSFPQAPSTPRPPRPGLRRSRPHTAWPCPRPSDARP